MSAVEMKLLVKAYILSNNVKIEVEHLVEAGGHPVLFTPAYHSDLQPIELVWALVKGNVGLQYYFFQSNHTGSRL
jgi:transposase